MRDKRAIIIGLTGSYAMGKTTAAGLFRDRGVSVHDADGAVHQLLGPGGKAVAAVAQHFPTTLLSDNSIDRRKLGDAGFADDNKRALLESILHPLVQERRQRWLQALHSAREKSDGQSADSTNTLPIAVFDVPLLFETGKETMCDYTVVVSAPLWVQKKRARLRGISDERLAAILARQMSDAEKRQRADYIIPTQFGTLASAWYIDRLLGDIRLAAGKPSPAAAE